jgi:predicted transposase YbfD/YdcC
MTHPDWVLKHKTKGTELRNIRGKYYIYKVTSKWDKVAKKSRKITLGQIGVITEEHGLIPTGEKKKGKIPEGASVFKNPFKEPKSESFLDHFAQIDDPRSEKNQLYTVAEILFVTFAAVICGANGWQDVEDYGKARINYLRQYLDYKNGAPSDDTIRRFFRNINPEQFEELFRDWVVTIAKKSDIKVIAIDGKTSRHSFDGDGRQLHMLSAFATERRIVVGQEKVFDKTNEITAIPKMLEWLDVSGHIVTIDAMGCQYNIANTIVQKGGNYIFALKGNQGNLAEDVRLYFEDPNNEYEHNICTDYDKAHGRIETRKCTVSNEVAWLHKMNPLWHSIKSIIMIKSTRDMAKKSTTETRYYISSLDEKADCMVSNIRSHWGIENSLHWILDMSFGDDSSRIRKGNAPHVMAIIRHFAANSLQLVKAAMPKPDRESIVRLRKKCNWDEKILDLALSTKNLMR